MMARTPHRPSVGEIGGGQDPAVDPEALADRIAEINRVMNTHAGAIELVDLTDAGEVTVRFVAMCQGCPFRSVTMFGLITPALEGVRGVTQVHVEGVRISEESRLRAAAAIGTDSAWPSLHLEGDE